MISTSQKQLILYDHVVNYYAWEPGHAVASIVLLHGWRSNSLVWFQCAAELAKQGFSVYAIDFPGFGRSNAPHVAFTLGDFAAIVEEFITKLQLHNLAVVGHSFGGRVAIKLAYTRPDFLERLILVSSGGYVQKTRRSFLAIIAKIVKPIFLLPYMKSFRKILYRYIGAEDYIATPGLQKTFTNIINEDVVPLCSKIEIPTLIIWGDKDAVAPVGFGAILHRVIVGSQLSIIKGCGHFPFVEKEEHFLKLLTSFLKVNRL